MDLPYITLRDADNDLVIVEVLDWELFDYVDDFLTEQHDLECEWISIEDKAGPVTRIVIAFSIESREKVVAALSQLDPDELRRIYAINNPS